MKNLIYVLIMTGGLLFTSSCNDFLEQSTPSDAITSDILQDPQSVLAYLNGAFDNWEGGNGWIHSRGLFYELSVCSSDAERHPEKYSDQQRHIPENFYDEGTGGFPIDFSENPWNQCYQIISVCNNLISLVDEAELVDEQKATGIGDDLSHIYGMAVTLRATIYYEMTRYYGDVPLQRSALEIDSSLTSRDEIWEFNIQKLEEVIPIMYRVGESSLATNKTVTRTYAEGLLGRLCLMAGGYWTRRTDVPAGFYSDLNGQPIAFEAKGGEYSGGIYNRRTDYLKFYEKAKPYLEACINNSGTARLVTTDPRATDANGRQFGNPFQYVFQQMLNLEPSPEVIYEVPEVRGSYSERPYAFGRPSDGGGSNNYPCKSYGQSRMHPVYFYGDFDPQDLRRDVTVAVTASSGKGVEIPLDLAPGSKSAGGLANNKWDENRMSPPYTVSQRASGVGNPYLRMSEVYLMLAEIDAVLGDEAGAKDLLSQVRVRGFGGNATAANVDGFIAKMGGVKEAVWEEKKLEFAGEGLRKWDMIRTGQIQESIGKLKSRLTTMIDGLESQGYYTFENGMTIPAYIWTKTVDLKADEGYRLTTQAPNETDPVLFPGWRGQYDDYQSVANANGDTRAKIEDELTNLAIQGLFTYIDPNGQEAAALEADGYVKTPWGQAYVDFRDEYSTFVFKGYRPGLAPIYMVPINTTAILTSNGLINNGYGFENPTP